MDDKLTIKQAAETLQVKPQALYNRIRRKTLEAVRIEGTWYIPQTEVERLRHKSDERSETGVCEECNTLRLSLREKVEQIEYMKQRVNWLELQLERQTLLLANEQSFRMKKALPRPLGWLKRVFGGSQSEVA